MRKIILTLLSLNLGLAAQSHAQDINALSEYFHQAPVGAFELTAGVGLEPGKTAWTIDRPNGVWFGTYAIKSNSAKAMSTVIPISVTGEYGFSPMFSLGLDLIYGSGSINYTNCSLCSSKNGSGLFNPAVYFKGNYVMGTGVLIYGLVADVGVENNKIQSNGNYNFASGGTTFTPYVGYQLAVGQGFWGLRLQYDAYKTDEKTDIPSGSATTKGGNKLAIDTFYEVNLGSYSLGGSVFYQQTPETKSSSPGGSSTGDSNATNEWGVQFYVPVRLTNATILPNIAYETRNYTQSGATYSSADAIQLGVSGRFTF